MKALLLSIIASAITIGVIGFINDVQQKNIVEDKISKCDSLQIEINVLKYQVEVMENRITKYQVGLEFLKDKDPKAYHYVINAGNLEFNDRL